MIPETLYLKGFAGIRAGLNRDELSLDLTQLVGDARLVAFSGPNGTGKTTVMDNLQPYRLLPSRASSFSPAGFSFYEHLVLPECVKELVWRHAGERYRSTLVFRMNGRRKTEAYLHAEENGQWATMKLPDGTVSDGRAETYDACVEALLGKPETFFTSVFAAQNRRPLASYTPGEIKGLMVELLGLEEIRQAGEKASQVARLLKNTLDERRRVLNGLGDVDARIRALEEALARCGHEVTQWTRDKVAAQAQLETAQVHVAQLAAERDAGRGGGAASRADHASCRCPRGVCQGCGDPQPGSRTRGGTPEEAYRRAARGALACPGAAEEVGEAARGGQGGPRPEARDRRRDRAGQDDGRDGSRGCGTRLEAAQTRDRSREERSKALAVLRTRAEGLRRQAGDAALRAAGLKQRFGLTDAVPCRGTELQPRCQLLADARKRRSCSRRRTRKSPRFGSLWTRSTPRSGPWRPPLRGWGTRRRPCAQRRPSSRGSPRSGARRRAGGSGSESRTGGAASGGVRDDGRGDRRVA